MKLYPYIKGSAGAKALALALGIKRIRHAGKPLKMRGQVLINWGSSNIKRELIPQYTILNKPEAVRKASNKLETFKALEGVCSIPEWTESSEDAYRWLDEGSTVVVRQKLNGHSGEGIQIITPAVEDLPIDFIDAPLYTKYVPKAEEYRIHVFQDDAFFIQRKARKKEVPDDKVNWQVRNHANGFVFAHNEGIDVGEGAKQLAVLAVKALGLDFGAVDLIYNKKQGKYYVLEVNTACGLQGETLNRYVEKLKNF